MKADRLKKNLAELKALFQTLETMLFDASKVLNQTAKELDEGEIHPAHAANRLRKVARQLTGKEGN